MGTLLALTGRELRSLWCSSIAYAVGAMFLLLQGIVFALLLAIMNDPRASPTSTMSQFFFGGTFFYWFAALITAPLLTMRTFSEEKRTGSIEFLLTAPVTNAQVVCSKFLGAWIAYVVLWLATLVLFLILRTITPFAWGPVLSGYIGTCLLGAVLISVGVLASSITSNQVISAIVGFVALLALFSVGLLDMFVTDPDASELIRYMSVVQHLGDSAKGILDTRPTVFYLSVTAICLFLTTRVVGSPRWRS